METPDPPNDTPGASKQVATWHPMASQGFLGKDVLRFWPKDEQTHKQKHIPGQ